MFNFRNELSIVIVLVVPYTQLTLPSATALQQLFIERRLSGDRMTFESSLAFTIICCG